MFDLHAWVAAMAHKCGIQELPHVRGWGQKPGGRHAQGVVAKRSYPVSEVMGHSLEYQAVIGQEQPRGVTPCPRSGMVSRRSYPMPEVRGRGLKEQPQVQGAVAAWVQEGLEELLQVQGQKGRQ